MIDHSTTTATTATSPDPAHPVADATIAALDAQVGLLQESLADVQRVMSRDEAGWAELGSIGDDPARAFDAAFRKNQAARILVATIANPIIKRGVSLRTAFVWGAGAAISVRDQPDQGQDVGAVVQAFLDDPANSATFTTTDARMQLERDLCTVGEVFLCLPTDPVTGRVRVRTIPAHQIVEIRTDPDDEASIQMYRREWTPKGSTVAQKAWHPALGYRPQQRDRAVDGIPVRWDAPIRDVRVNRAGDRGMGDLFAAVPWADAYKRFLESWAQLMHALSRIAVQLRTRGDRVSRAAAQIAQAAQVGESGQGIALDPNSALEVVSTSGARFDADSGRPLAVMAAAALDLPVTTLLGDPGVTGARAVAEQVSDDSWLAFDVRRDLWATVVRDVCGWVIDAAIIAPAGPLRGTIARDGDRQYAILPEGDGRSVQVEWPKRDSTALLDRVKAIQAAGQSQTLPPLVELRLYMEALGVDDIDDVLDMVSDDNGNFVPLDVLDARVRDVLGDRGQG